MTRKGIIVLSLLALCSTSVFGGVKQGEAPKVIPAVQEWTASKGTLVLPHSGVINYKQGDSAMEKVAHILAEDLKLQSGYEYTADSKQAKKAAVRLEISAADSLLGAEGYVLKVTDKVTITSSTARGVFWGTRTLLQMLHNQNGVLAKGTIRDYPEYPSRGFMLDVARKFFTIDYLRDYVKIMSYYKMNEFQIHLNDNGFPAFFDNNWDKTYAAFRMESDRFPGLTAKDGHYGKDEFKEFQRMALDYGVLIIPEIDVPAHSLSFVHYKPEIGSELYGRDHLDIYKPETFEFVDTLLAEYIAGDDPVFIGPEVHIGTDEYNKKEAEQYRYFTDRYLKYVKSFGKNPRMWGGLKWLDGKTPVFSDGVTVNVWSHDWVDPVKSLEDGYKVINTCDEFLYIVPAAGYYWDFLNCKWLYDNWSPLMMNSRQTLTEKTPEVLGGMFAVWNDKCGNGISEKDVHYRSFPAMQVLAEKMWRGSDSSMSYADFEKLASGSIEAPGVNVAGAFTGDFGAFAESVYLGGKNAVATNIGIVEAGYPYSVSFDVCSDSVQSNSGVLFSSPNAKFYANWENTGRFAFERDGYVFTFPSYRLPAAEWTNIAVKGDLRGTSLYVNGELMDRLEGRTQRAYNARYNRLENMKIMETLVFPLEIAGDKRNGFAGSLKNLKVTRSE